MNAGRGEFAAHCFLFKFHHFKVRILNNANNFVLIYCLIKKYPELFLTFPI